MNTTKKPVKETEKPTHDPDLAVIWERLPEEFVAWEKAPEIRRLAELIGIESRRQSEAKGVVKGTTESLAARRVGLCFAVHDHILKPKRETSLGFKSKRRFVEDCLAGLLFQRASNTWDMIGAVEIAEEHGLERNHVQLNWTSALALKRAQEKLRTRPKVFGKLVEEWKEHEGTKMVPRIREVVKSTNSSVFNKAGSEIIRGVKAHLALGEKSNSLAVAVEQFTEQLERVLEEHQHRVRRYEADVVPMTERSPVEEEVVS